jgi:putative transposase
VKTAPRWDALVFFGAFAQRWDRRFPSISRSWREHWQRVIPLFAHPPEIRKVIHTTNAIDSINATLRKVTRKRGSFPNPDSVRRVPYLAIRKASEHWAGPIRDWVAALKHFTMAFEGRVPNR